MICNLRLPDNVVFQSIVDCVNVYKTVENYILHYEIDGFTIVSIRGTNCMNDWITNVKFLFKKEDIHRGFKRNAKTVFLKLIARNALRLNKNIVLCGHSLGGATATVLSDLLIRSNLFLKENVFIITYGSPRPGGRKLRRRLEDVLHLRFIHADDLVPSTPPYFCGYVHTHEALFLEDTDDQPMDGIEDHYVHNYLIAIDRLLHCSSSVRYISTSRLQFIAKKNA